MQKKMLCTLILIFVFLLILYKQGEKKAWAEKEIFILHNNKPQRIVSLSLAADEFLLALVEKKRIAALTYLSVDPGISNVAEAAQQIKEHIYADTEKVISLHPDLVVASSFTPVTVIQTLREAGLRVYVFSLGDNLHDIKKSILDVAQAVGEKEKGEKLVQKMEKKEREIERKIKKQNFPSSSILYYGFSGSTSGEGTQFDELVKKVGLKNAATQAGIKGRTQINKEKLIQLNPDIIVMPTWTLKVQKADLDSAEELLHDPSLACVEAIKKKRVYSIPDNHFSCCTQNIILGIEDLFQLAYR